MDKLSALHRRKHLSRLLKATLPFVGHSQELDWSERCLQGAAAGRPHVVLIPGQAGIGKTRLLQELRSGALRRGLQIGYSRGYEDLSLPYLSFIEYRSLTHPIRPSSPRPGTPRRQRCRSPSMADASRPSLGPRHQSFHLDAK